MINFKKYVAKDFKIGKLKGISEKNIEEHLNLYKGYVNNTNLVLDKINQYEENLENNSYAMSELNRRLAFEFGGIRNHENYFGALEGNAEAIDKESKLYKEIKNTWGSYEKWENDFKKLATTRGVGWAMLYYDNETGNLINHWVDEQHIGHLVGLSPILCLDMWEHAFVYDYATSEKKKYIDIFFENLNWSVIEENFKKVI